MVISMKQIIVYPLIIGLYFGDAAPLYARHKRIPTPPSFSRLNKELSHQKSRLEYLTGREVRNWPAVSDTIEVDEKEEQKKSTELNNHLEKITDLIEILRGGKAAHHSHETSKCTYDNGYWHCNFSR